MDLCRRIVVCFSSGDLGKLAESLGASDAVSWSRGANEAARGLVRCFKHKNDLESLVARLRAERPLVEWPEPPEASPAGMASAGGLESPGPLAGPGFLTWPNDGGVESAKAAPPPAPPATPDVVPA